MDDVVDKSLVIPHPPAAATHLGLGHGCNWVSKGLGNTLQSQNMIANYFPVWVVAVMAGSDSQITLSNTVIMLLMIGLGPGWGPSPICSRAACRS
ncbi:MAG: hypothetical protein U0075_20305 [Thermomicrobiales bacterium]